MEAVLFSYTSRPNASMQLNLTTCDVTTCNNISHQNHVITCLATMSSLMRTKSRRWSAAMPNALWMLCKSAAMSGSMEDSVQRWLQKVHTHTHTTTYRLFTDTVSIPFWLLCGASLDLLVFCLLYLPTEDFEHLASVVVGIQDFRFCCLC